MPSAAAHSSSNWQTWQNNVHKDKGLRKSMISIFTLYFCIFTAGYDSSLLNGLQTLDRWQTYFGNPTSSDLGLISASMYFPTLVMPFIAVIMCERWGRRLPIFVGSIILIAGTFVMSFAQNRGMFIGGRVIIGAGAAFQGVAAPPMIMELCHPRLRAVAGASYLCMYYIGSTVSSWACFGTLNLNSDWSWRIPCLLCMLGALVNAFYIALGFMEESPRWLIKAGQREKGYSILAKLYANGQVDDELVVKSLAEIEKDLEQESLTKNSGYDAFFKTPGNRKRLLVIFMLATGTQLNGVGLVSYYLAPILELVGISSRTQQAGLNGGLAIFNLICALAAAQVVEKLGRRPLWLASNTGQLVCFVIVTALSGSFAYTGNKSTGIAVIPFLYLYYGFYDIGWTVLPNLYIPEITPFQLRAKAMGLYSFIQAVSLVFNQYVNPIALSKIAWKYYIVYIFVIAAYLTYAIFCLVETKGYTIEEVSRLFDGQDAVDDIEREGDYALETSEAREKKMDVSHVEHF